MGNNSYLSAQDVQAFSDAIKMLNESLDDLSKVFQSLVPEVLSIEGLRSAISELCDLVKRDFAISATYIFDGDEVRMESSYEMALYSIAVELVTNVIKHSGADSLLIQLSKFEKRIVLVVKDNGKGFDPVKSENGVQSGLNQIRTHLKTFQGWMAITSDPAKGTEVMVELNW